MSAARRFTAAMDSGEVKSDTAPWGLGMAFLGVALTLIVLFVMVMTLLVRSRARHVAEQDAATVPTRRAYLDRFWLYALQGYRTAKNSGWARGIHGCAAEASAAAGFIPNSKIMPGMPGIHSTLAWGISRAASTTGGDSPRVGRFDLLIDSAISDGTLARLSEEVDAWIPIYERLGVQDAESWAVRKVALHWSLISGPGQFRPELAWSSFPTVDPSTRHRVASGERPAPVRFPGQRADLAPMTVFSGPPSGDDVTLQFTETVHRGAMLEAVAQLAANPDTADEELGLGLLEWFKTHMSDSPGPFAASARAYWTLDVLTDAVADKAYALRVCTVVAVRDALMEDSDSTDDHAAATAKRRLWEALHPAISAQVPDDFLNYLATVYSTRARLSGQPPDVWADEACSRLNEVREKRKSDQAIEPTALA